MISKATIDKIIDTARIEEVVGDFVDLKKRGASLIGVCPFHDEKTPSFHVSVSKGIFKCFGCGAGGDALKFVMELEKYSYPEAIRFLADKYHIEIEEIARSPEQVAAEDKRESLYIINQWANKYFKEQLWNTSTGRNIGLSYFQERGYREDIIKKFDLGYSPDQWTGFVDEALKAGFSKSTIKEVGLAVERDDGSQYDRFRGRVLFPIHSLTGRILGFGGRTLKTEKSVPKYVNSPESEIYNKSEVLYGLHFARKAISTHDSAYLVEGYADVLSMHQAGVENVIASSGTSLTKGQIRLVARYTNNIVLLFDGDAAGIQASLRGTDMLLEEGLNVKVLLFEGGDDPDSYIKKNGSTAFKNHIDKNALDFIFYKTDILLKEANSDPVKKAAVIRDVVESIALIPDDIKASLFIRQCSTLLDIEERILLSEMNKIRIQKSKQQNKRTQAPVDRFPSSGNKADDEAGTFGTDQKVKNKTLDSEVLLEREIVRILLNYGAEIAHWESEDVPVAPLLLQSIEDVTFTDKASADIVSEFRKRISQYEIPEAKEFFAHQNEAVSRLAIDSIANKYELSENWNDDKRQIYVTKEIEHLKELVIQGVYRIKKKKIQVEIEKIREELKTEKNDADIEILLSKYQKLKTVEKDMGDFLGNTIVK